MIAAPLCKMKAFYFRLIPKTHLRSSC